MPSLSGSHSLGLMFAMVMMSSSVGLSQFWNKSRQWMSTRKGSDITTDLGDTTTNDNGADDFVNKPVIAKQLAIRILNCLERRT